MRHTMIVIVLTLAGMALGAVHVQDTDKHSKGITMTARGTFDVKLIPQPAGDSAAGPFGRFFLDKKFGGDLDATSKGQMLASGGPTQGAGGYVALELVTGTLDGRRGSFVLLHRGTMNKDSSQLDVTIVPDSGTEELIGIAGVMTIVVEGGTHSYEFAYTLPAK